MDIESDIKSFIDSISNEMIDDTYKFINRLSPVDTGNYKSNHEVTYSYGYSKIENSVDYSLVLEAGWSKQAPNGVYIVAFERLLNKNDI